MNVWNHIELQELLQIHRYSVSIYSRMIVSIYMSSLVRGIYSMTECIIPSCRGCESSHRGTTCECVYHPCTIRKIIFQGKTRENLPVYPEDHSRSQFQGGTIHGVPALTSNLLCHPMKGRSAFKLQTCVIDLSCPVPSEIVGCKTYGKRIKNTLSARFATIVFVLQSEIQAIWKYSISCENHHTVFG